MPEPRVVPLVPRAQEPSLDSLAARARRLQEQSSTGSLQSLRTVLTALVLSATEAVELLPDESIAAGMQPTFERSLGAVGAYLVHSCELAKVPLGDAIAARFERDEAELPESVRRSSG